MNEKEFQLILQEGEGYKIEFKESLSGIDKELVAFANASGGRVFFWVTDNKKIKSITINNKLKSQIQDIANNCDSPVKILFDDFKDIFIITVREREDKPYKCSSGFYTRVGPNSQKLNRDEIIEFIKAEGENAMNFLKQYIPVRYEMIGEPRRREVSEIPYDALQEAIIYAVANRDYFEKGSNIMVEMFDDRIEIANFGGLPKGLNPKDFWKRSVLRNPNIADLLHRIKYIEKMGTGIRKIQTLVAGAGLPSVKFEFGTFFTAIFRRQKIKSASEMRTIEKFKINFNNMLSREGINEGIKNRLLREILHIKQYGFFTRGIIERLSKISTATAERDIAFLKKNRHH
jgi:predicted HTH transcriptional regulator